jgi:hypothetical protein
VDAATAEVVTLKVALVLPAAMVTDAGTVAAPVLPLDKVTTVAEGAAADRVTVPCEPVPPCTDVGLSAIDFTRSEFITNERALEIAPSGFATETDATPDTETSEVVMAA